MLISRYRLLTDTVDSKNSYNLTNTNLTFNNWWVFNTWVIVKNSNINSQLYNTSRSYVCEFKLKSYLNFWWILILDYDQNNWMSWIWTIWTNWWLRLKEWWWDTIISTQTLELNKWYQIILSYNKDTWKCNSWLNWKYLWEYLWITNLNTPILTTLQIWLLEWIYPANVIIKNVELYNNPVDNSFAKNKYLKCKWFI